MTGPAEVRGRRGDPQPLLDDADVKGRRTSEDVDALRADIERLTDGEGTPNREEARSAVSRLFSALSAGQVRAAVREDDGWGAVSWVKRGILLAFKVGETREFRPYPTEDNADFGGSTLQYFDRDTLPLRKTRGVEENIRIVPGGTSIREGAYIAPNVVLMPPAYVNVGAFVDEGAMIDSHALVGSCAQVGKRVHLSAGAQLGGVLEPVGLRPVIIEDDVLIAGNCGVFEATLVGRRSVLAPGVQLTRSTAVYDLVRGEIYRATEDAPLTIPDGAVVVPGSRPASGDFAKQHGVALYAPVIVKYRDEKTEASAALEQALR
ncbi:MAG: 2,3,4,5-tetrahydropyridine-2,6-dicarboxylate N-succinyltransferase [Gemmatimonadetes bacterium]|nr:2,3,4,5-tetrahydropyridine-2,6-dicarboxylate N-succinyltransferase [Gemmatimonadota bacterium]